MIATVSSKDKANAASEAGAEAVVNYRDEDVAARIADLTNGSGVDHLIEVNLGINGPALGDLMAPNGFVAVYGSDWSSPT